jgi:hypothetical protein
MRSNTAIRQPEGDPSDLPNARRPGPPTQGWSGTGIRLWRRWVAANGLSEVLGLGATGAVMALGFSRLESLPGAAGVLLAFLLAVGSGAIEATLVGLAQWWAMHPWFPGITRRRWWLATLVGALVAYVLGWMPSTLMSLNAEASQAQVAEPPQSIMLLFAALLGAAAGAALSFAQWLVLRRQVRRAGWWIPANMLAWLVGMPIIFWAIDAAQRMQSPTQTLLLLAGCLLLTGVIVGAIHGAFLVRLAREAGEEVHARPRVRARTPAA